MTMILNIDYSYINSIINARECYYTRYEISKKSGGKRILTSPCNKLKEIQLWIYTNILKKHKLHDACMGFREGKSIVDNAKIHKGNECILKIDLEDFFGTITENRVYKVFKDIGYHGNLAVYLAKLTTVRVDAVGGYDKQYIRNYKSNSVLPQGAPTSPMLSNIIAIKLDERLCKLAQSLEVNYSRYADDITFSGNKEKLPSIGVIKKILIECGFKINYKKIKYIGKNQGQKVTGISIHNGVRVPKKYKKETKSHLYYCKKFGVQEHLKYLKDHKDFNKNGFREWLLGRIYFINSVEPKVAKNMLKDFNEIEWTI